MIVKQGSKYVIKSHKGKTLGTYSSKAAAVKRLGQIEYFKHQHGKFEEENPDILGTFELKPEHLITPKSTDAATSSHSPAKEFDANIDTKVKHTTSPVEHGGGENWTKAQIYHELDTSGSAYPKSLMDAFKTHIDSFFEGPFTVKKPEAHETTGEGLDFYKGKPPHEHPFYLDQPNTFYPRLHKQPFSKTQSDATDKPGTLKSTPDATFKNTRETWMKKFTFKHPMQGDRILIPETKVSTEASGSAYPKPGLGLEMKSVGELKSDISSAAKLFTDTPASEWFKPDPKPFVKQHLAPGDTDTGNHGKNPSDLYEYMDSYLTPHGFKRDSEVGGPAKWSSDKGIISHHGETDWSLSRVGESNTDTLQISHDDPRFMEAVHKFFDLGSGKNDKLSPPAEAFGKLLESHGFQTGAAQNFKQTYVHDALPDVGVHLSNLNFEVSHSSGSQSFNYLPGITGRLATHLYNLPIQHEQGMVDTLGKIYEGELGGGHGKFEDLLHWAFQASLAPAFQSPSGPDEYIPDYSKHESAKAEFKDEVSGNYWGAHNKLGIAGGGHPRALSINEATEHFVKPGFGKNADCHECIKYGHGHGKNAEETPVSSKKADVKKRLLETREGVKIFQVDGGRVRNSYDIDFLGGSNGMACPEYVDENSVWVESGISDQDALVLHELTELKLMNSGADYHDAHTKAEEAEAQFRASRKQK